MSYFGKTAYKGDTAVNYQQDRVAESIWQKEQQWVAAFLETVKDQAVLLDIPVGSGRFLELYAPKKIKVLGLDVSSDMVAVARSAQDALPEKHAVVQLRVGDAEHLDIADNAVDYLLCFRLFHLIPFPVIKKIIKEFHRVSAGPVIIEVFNSSLLHKQEVSLLSAVKKIKQQLKSWLTSARTGPSEIASPWAHITNSSYPYELLVKEFRNAGFKNISIEKIDDSENPVTIFILSK